MIGTANGAPVKAPNTQDIILYVRPTRCNVINFIFLETALHVSGGTTTHHQERKQLYVRHLAFAHRYCYLLLTWKSWNLFECAVGGVRQML